MNNDSLLEKISEILFGQILSDTELNSLEEREKEKLLATARKEAFHKLLSEVTSERAKTITKHPDTKINFESQLDLEAISIILDSEDIPPKHLLTCLSKYFMSLAENYEENKPQGRPEKDLEQTMNEMLMFTDIHLMKRDTEMTMAEITEIVNSRYRKNQTPKTTESLRRDYRRYKSDDINRETLRQFEERFTSHDLYLDFAYALTSRNTGFKK